MPRQSDWNPWYPRNPWQKWIGNCGGSGVDGSRDAYTTSEDGAGYRELLRRRAVTVKRQ